MKEYSTTSLKRCVEVFLVLVLLMCPILLSTTASGSVFEVTTTTLSALPTAEPLIASANAWAGSMGAKPSAKVQNVALKYLKLVVSDGNSVALVPKSEYEALDAGFSTYGLAYGTTLTLDESLIPSLLLSPNQKSHFQHVPGEGWFYGFALKEYSPSDVTLAVIFYRPVTK